MRLHKGMRSAAVIPNLRYVGCASSLPLDSLSSLALFAHVVRLKSFSAAARECKIAKSAVSRRVAQLEDRLGVTLLRRSTRAVSVTEEGLRVYEHCAALLAAAEAAEGTASEAGEGIRGTLRVNAPVTFAQMHLAAAIASFLDQPAKCRDRHLRGGCASSTDAPTNSRLP